MCCDVSAVSVEWISIARVFCPSQRRDRIDIAAGLNQQRANRMPQAMEREAVADLPRSLQCRDRFSK